MVNLTITLYARMESVHIIHFYGYPCCIWPVYTWGKEWAHTWWETKECLQKEQKDLLSFLLERELGGLPTSHSLFQVSLECEIQHLPLFYLNQVFVCKKKRFGWLILFKQMKITQIGTNRLHIQSMGVSSYHLCLANSKAGGKWGTSV